MIISALLSMLIAHCAAQDMVRRGTQDKFLGEAGDAPFYVYPNQLPAAFCAKHKLTCVLDITSPRVHCEFSSSIRKELDKATVDAGKRLFEKQCHGNSWKIADGIHVFEPHNEQESSLNRKVGAIDSGKKVAPSYFIFERAGAAGLRQAPGHGLGAGSAGKPPIRFRTPAGTLKTTLISAAKQYPGTVWAVVRIKEGFLFNAE